MRNIQEAEGLLQRAYDIDTGKREGSIDPQQLEDVGPQTLHIVYYDSGLASNVEIREHLKSFPDGVFAKLIRSLRDIRVQAGEYTEETLNRMYGLVK